MKVALVGPEIEENLGLRYLAASLLARGHEATVVPFDTVHEIAAVATQVATPDVDVIGLSMMFQLRAREFVVLAERIRMLGWRGVLVAGGQHATFMADDILADNPAFDAIVLGDGEAPLCDVIGAIATGSRPIEALLNVPGLVVRTDDGAVVRTACRTERTDLDALPSPIRDPHPKIHLGLASAPMIASRGCYASCSFCSIAAWEKLSGGARYRVRPPEAVAREMAALYWERDVKVFNFHDDNFWFPKVEANRERLAQLARALEAERVGEIALLFKCRPPDVDPALFAQAKEMGMVRIYVGIETDAPAGLVSLRRGVAQPQNQRALDVLSSLDVHALSNLLLFDPDTRLGDIEYNIGFIERNARHTLNFCRVEPYGGTPLTRRLREEGRLTGDYLGFDYTLREPRVELMWRMVHVIFHDRNFPAEGLANALIGLQYRFHVAKRFWPSPALETLRAPIADFIVRFNRDQARLLRRVYDHVKVCALDDRDGALELVRELSVAVRHGDARMHAECAALIETVERYAARQGAGGSSGRLGEGAAGSGWWHLGASLATLALAACQQESATADTAKKPAPAPKVALPTCNVKATPKDQLVLHDDASVKLVEKALPLAKADKKTGEWKLAATDVEGTINFAGRTSPGNGCSGGSFIGFDVSATLAGKDAAGYELVGISGWQAIDGASIARGAKDEWVHFTVGNPGRNSHQHVGVVWKKRGAKADDAPLVVAAEIPPDPTPPPPPPQKGQMRMPGCDPVAMPVPMSAPVNSDRAVHIAITQQGLAAPGQLGFASWLDETVKGKLKGSPSVTADFGTAQFTYTDMYGYGSNSPHAYFSYEARCADGHLLPRKVKVKIDWPVDVGHKVRTFSGTVELQISATGDVTAVPPKASMLDEFQRLPLERRFHGQLDQTPQSDGTVVVRAVGPYGVELTGARWHADGAELEPTVDPLVVRARLARDDASIVCVMEVPDGMCIASTVGRAIAL